MIVRKIVNFPNHNSFFLLCPRQTGKTTSVKAFLKDFPHWHVNLLIFSQLTRYQKNSDLFHEDFLYQKTKNNIKYVFIDEVQKAPFLLDEIHELIESNKDIYFIMSGSSARKLKKASANMLGGRALVRKMFPFTQSELGDQFSLERVLGLGTLPGIYFKDDESAIESLQSYIEVYLKEEIMAEALVRNYEHFSRFLEVAAQHAAELLSYENISRECAVNAKSVKGYFEILEDTLIGFILPIWEVSIKKQLSSKPKFYFFDNGVMNALTGVQGKLQPTYRGKVFEQFIINEVRAFLNYKRSKIKMFFWRTKAGSEVDLLLVLNEKIIAAIEIKAIKECRRNELSGLRSFSEDYPDVKELLLVCEEPHSRMTTPPNITILNYKEFLNRTLHDLDLAATFN